MPEPDWHVRLGAAGYDVTVEGALPACRARFALGGREFDLAVASAWKIGEALFRARIGDDDLTIQAERQGVAWRLTHAGASTSAVILSRRVAALAAQMPLKAAADTSKFLLSPMPGLLVSLAVKAGQPVRAGEELAVVEAMKMQNVLRAEQDGTVKSLHAKPGESLAVDQAIVEFA
jgi:propionyl-CoA carboxylase alpha chain